VTGLPALTRPEAMSSGEARTRIVQLYREVFGLSLPAPAVAKKHPARVASDPWVSTAYVGGRLHQIDLYPDGRVEAFSTTAGRPAGTCSPLVVFLDHGSLDLDPGSVLVALSEATDAANRAHGAYPIRNGSDEPILRLETEGVVVPSPKRRSRFLLTLDEIRSLTGFEPTGFDWVAQVELDAAGDARRAGAAEGWPDACGVAVGCDAGRLDSAPHLWATIEAASQLYGKESRLLTVLLTHEVHHLFGYPSSQDWPCAAGTRAEPSDCCGPTNVPALLLGWTDTDGDETPEILDPSPYGLATP